MAKNNFLLSDDWEELFNALPDDKAGQLIKAAFAFHNGKEPNLTDPVLKAVFVMIRTKIEERDAAYEQTCEDNRRHVQERWKRKKEQQEEEPIREDTTVYDRIRNDTDRDRDKDKDSDKEVGRDRDKDRGVGEEETPTPPAAPPAAALILEDGSTWYPEPELYAQLKTAYADIDVDAEFRKMAAACLADPRKRRSKEHVSSFVLKWLRNAEKDQTDQPKETRPPNTKARKGFDDFESRNYTNDEIDRLEMLALKRTYGEAMKA